MNIFCSGGLREYPTVVENRIYTQKDINMRGRRLGSRTSPLFIYSKRIFSYLGDENRGLFACSVKAGKYQLRYMHRRQGDFYIFGR